MLTETATSENKKIHEICIEATAAYFGISPDDLRKMNSRRRDEAYRRQVCFYIIRKNDKEISFETIARIFGSTRQNIQYAFLRVDSIIDLWKPTQNDVKVIQQIIDNLNSKRLQWLGQSNS